MYFIISLIDINKALEDFLIFFGLVKNFEQGPDSEDDLIKNILL